MPEAAGRVEREARELVEAAARWLSVVPDNAEYAARTRDPETDSEAPVGSGDGRLRGEGAVDGAADSSQWSHDRAEAGAHQEERLCRGCPWCRAKAAAGPVGADTLDSLAHLLSAAAESLSLFAQSRRESAGGHEGRHASEPEPDQNAADQNTADQDPPRQGPGQARRADDVSDAVIDWDDEDEDELLADEDEVTRPPSKERKVR